MPFCLSTLFLKPLKKYVLDWIEPKYRLEEGILFVSNPEVVLPQGIVVHYRFTKQIEIIIRFPILMCENQNSMICLWHLPIVWVYNTLDR